MIDVGIVGASGYGGGELIRWLSFHPSARVAEATSNTYASQPVSAAFAGLAGLSELRFTTEDDPRIAECNVVFLARDNGQAMKLAPPLLDKGCKVIELGKAPGYDLVKGRIPKP